MPLYRDSYRLLNQVIVLTQSFPRFFRFGLGVRMVDLCMDMISMIFRANSSYDKLPALLELTDRHRMLQMLFRVCVEQKLITERQYAGYAMLLDQMGRQITGWRQYAEKGAAGKVAKTK